jgi:hypothetical protein
LNHKTRARFASHCGASRFAFNWGLHSSSANSKRANKSGKPVFASTDAETDALASAIEVREDSEGRWSEGCRALERCELG